MKRPPGPWILLFLGIFCWCLANVNGLRATSLIFGKTSTTTTTTTTAPDSDAAAEENVTTEQVAESNTTKPVLTGVPQVDYVWDPNLPKELNGYNLSDYPFYERVPEDIDFKCDGLHDGFYASVKHKCQVYHHCLFGTRYDFLCANYTAFDQKTFICHFASEVDCANSKKFWHRNDALYQSATTTTTTTIKPLNIYTPPPQPIPIQPQEPSPPRNRRPYPRRPIRRRPQYDYYDEEYYDDYYEDRPRSTRGRKRPRPRPRPYYEDDYEDEYEDDRYERRGVGGRKRGPYEGRKGGTGRRRYKDRVKDEYDDDDYRLTPRRKNNEKKREPDYPEDDDEKYVRRHNSDHHKRNRKPAENDSLEDRNKEDSRPIIKPASGTIYDKPRVAPRIKPPVPKNEAEKYAYKPIAKPNLKAYDDVEDYAQRKPVETKERKSYNNNRFRSRPKDYYDYDVEKANKNKETKSDSSEEYYDDDYEDEIEEEKPKQLSTSTTTTTTTTTTTLPPPPPRIEKLKEPLIRLVKRPFLPSRGGNPYASRGLQPVGARALGKESEETQESSTQQQYLATIKPSDHNVPSSTALPPKHKKNPLDITEDEYDVTLNEAINPTLPNLPVRSYPSGFSARDSYYNNDQARYSTNQQPIFEYVYEPKVQRQRFAVIPQTSAKSVVVPSADVRERFVHSSVDFKGQYSVINENYRPRVGNVRNAQAYYKF